jgi:hypothetical protein
MTQPNDHSYEWTSPRKTLFYHMDQSDGAQRRLYLAVIQGEVRARLNGRVLGPKLLKQVEAMEQDEPFTLPPDLELSVKDVMRKWPMYNGSRQSVITKPKKYKNAFCTGKRPA